MSNIVYEIGKEDEVIKALTKVSEKNIKYLDFEETWFFINKYGLQPLFNYILPNNANNLSRNLYSVISVETQMMTYTLAYNLSTQRENNAIRLIYDAQKKTIEDFFTVVYNQLNRIENDNDFIQSFIKFFNSVEKELTKYIFLFFCYLERYFTKQEHLDELSYQIKYQFIDIIFVPLKDRIINFMIKNINLCRDNLNKNMDLMVNVRNLSKITQKLGNKKDISMYTLYVIDVLYKNTKDYYEKNVEQRRSSLQNIEYCANNFQYLECERQLNEMYLHKNDYDQNISIFIDCTIKDIYMQILHDNHGIYFVLQNQLYTDLAKMYTLVSLIEDDTGITEIGNIFANYVNNTCVERFNIVISSVLAQGEKLEVKLSTSFINLFNEFNEILQNKLNNHTIIQKIYVNKLTDIVNRTVSNLNFYDVFAIHIDDLIKKDELNTNETIDNIITLSKQLVQKDVFILNCCTYLSKRVLTFKVKDDDLERTLVSKLKKAFGTYYTNKMQEMIKDYSVTKTFINNFEGSPYCQIPVKFEPMVFSAGNWPRLPNPTTAILPKDLSDIYQQFNEYYEELNTQTRKLVWIHTYGSILIHMNMPNNSKTYKITMAPIQYIVFSLYNDESVNTLTFDEIKSRTNMPVGYLKRVLHSLSMSKYKLLVKESEGNSIQESDSFTLNPSFSLANLAFTLPLPSFEESVNNETKIEEDRTHSIQAAIVRIMKSSRTKLFNDLITDVSSQLTLFRPTVKSIKENIEFLIRKDYIERDEINMNKINYLA